MLLNSNLSATQPGLDEACEALDLSSRRRTAWLLKATLWGGVAWFGYQVVNLLGSHNTLPDSPVATMAFLALCLTLAAYVAMRQRTELLQQTRVQTAQQWGAELEKAGLVGAIEEASDAVVITDADGIIQYVNPAYTRMTGYSAEEVVGHHVPKEKSGPGRALHKQVREFLQSGKTWRGEIASRRKDGSFYTEEISIAPIAGAGGAIAKYIAIRRETTARKTVEEAGAWLASIVESSEDAIMSTTPEGTIVSWNRGGETIYGYSTEEILGKPVTVLFPVAQSPETDDLLDRIHRGETVSQHETLTVNREGRPVEVSLTISAVRNSAGAVAGASVIARDMRGRRRDREALQQSEERYRSLVTNLPDVVWVADQNGRPTFVSANCQAILGFTQDEIYEPGFWTKRIHPEDLPRVESRWRALFEEGRAVDSEYRFLRPDGQWIWLHSRAVNSYECDGQRYRSGLLTDITARKRMEQKLAYQVTHDLLTGLPNRTVFDDRVGQALARARRKGSMAALLYLDLDRFKRINDTLGHLAGDKLIQLASERLAGCLRDSETLSRSGGDRFMLILGDLHDPQDAANVADRILETLSAPFSVRGSEIFLTASIGIALYPQDGEDLTDLRLAADSALHAAKRQGKSKVQMSTPELGRAASRRLAIETELHYALERGELSVHYQPQFDLSTNRIAGLEALVRWDNPKFGQVPASVLIPIAEESGLIVPIGAYVLREACRQARAWTDAGYGPIQVAVNASAVQFARGGLAQMVADTLQETGLEAHRLDLEVTESVIMHDLEESARQLRQLKELGVSVSLDDFGTGYSSLSYLEELPIDNLKIDRKFVQRMNGADSTSTLVQSIVGLAHSMGMQAIAEGVETNEQLEQLRAMGCDRAQSYMLGGPAPALCIQALLTQAAA